MSLRIHFIKTAGGVGSIRFRVQRDSLVHFTFILFLKCESGPLLWSCSAPFVETPLHVKVDNPQVVDHSWLWRVVLTPTAV